MRARFRWCGLALVVGLILCCRPASVQAHPNFCGLWSAQTPPGGFMTYEFGVGHYIGNGIWRGPFCHVVSGLRVEWGVYELRMFTGTDGTISLKEGLTLGGSTVGIVDLSNRTVMLMNVLYRR